MTQNNLNSQQELYSYLISLQTDSNNLGFLITNLNNAGATFQGQPLSDNSLDAYISNLATDSGNLNFILGWFNDNYSDEYDYYDNEQ